MRETTPHLCCRCHRVSTECEPAGSPGDLDWYCPDCARLLWAEPQDPEPGFVDAAAVLIVLLMVLVLVVWRIYWR